ncbi:MAG: hypothetical protein HY647_02935 [Acidobacteria bacterium]|nr:hypothetical protein [Acidobacteriota bacterium]
MKNPFVFLFASVVKLVRQSFPPLTKPALSPEQFRKMLEEALTDPQTARLFARSLLHSGLPVQGGMACPTVEATGTNTNNKLTKWSNAASCTVTDSAVYDDGSGKVGIGTTSLASKLNVAGGSTNGVTVDVNNGVSGLIFAIAGTNKWAQRVSNNNFHIRESNVEDRVTILPGGNVGIGTTAPQQALTLGPSKVLAMEMVSPGTPTLGATQAGGSLSGTYYYKITALDGTGETVGSEEASVTVTSPNNAVNVSWSAVPGAKAYRIYRRPTSGGYTYYTSSPTSPTSFVDTGAAGTSGSPPTVTTAYVMKLNSSGNVQIGNRSEGSGAWQTLLLGTNAPKQQSFGPEMITAAATNPNDSTNRRVVLWSGAAADAEAMFLINSTGFLEWGAGGSNDQDSSLSRNASGEMALVNDKAFIVARSTGGGDRMKVNTDTNPTYIVIINGADGSATLDIKAVSTTYPTVRAQQSSESANIFGGFVGTETQLSFVIGARGKLSWGPGGSSSTDIDLLRFESGSVKGLQLVGGDLYILTSGKGIILKSPDGTKCARISLDNNGNLITTSLTCP